jgi:pyruvate dehydrogenase E1 component alpha subunit
MDHELIADLYSSMLLIRKFELAAARLYSEGKITGSLQLYTGHESIASGAASVIEDRDYVISSSRCHGHYLARGGSPRHGMAELLGKATGCSRGRSGHLGLFDLSKNFFGGWSLCGDHLPIAAGLAFAQNYLGTDSVTLCFLNNEAVDSGSFHEALALTSLWKVPVVFIIENDHSMATASPPISGQYEDLSIKALGYPLARDCIDGQDIFAVRSSVHSAVRRAREQKLPTLIEAITYNLQNFPLPASSEPTSIKADLENKPKDPILTLKDKLIHLGMQKACDKIAAAVTEEIQEAVKFAEDSPFPDPETAGSYVYTE